MALEVRKADLPLTLAVGTAVTIVTVGVLLILYRETDIFGCVAAPCFQEN